MKIAVWHNLPSGGGKRALYYHVKGLIERGHEVEAWCPTSADAHYLPLHELIVEHRLPITRPSYPLIGRFSKSLAEYLESRARQPAMDEHCKRCAEEINKSGADVLFANSSSYFAVTAIGRFVDLPKALYLQEPQRSLYEATPDLPWRALPSAKPKFSVRNIARFFSNLVKVQALRVRAREEYQNAKAFDTILVNTLFSRESLLRAYGLDSKVCYLGIDTELFKQTNSPKERLTVGLGAVHFGKRIDRAIRAIASIEESRRPILVWIGNRSGDQYQKMVLELAKELGVSIEFRVAVSDHELVDLLSRASAMIYTPQLEPFGFAPLEANACGTPVVAIAEGGIRETIKDGINGFLIYNDDSQALGVAITRLLDEPELVARMSITSREYVLENWQWKYAIDRLEAYLSSTIANGI